MRDIDSKNRNILYSSAGAGRFKNRQLMYELLEETREEYQNELKDMSQKSKYEGEIIMPRGAATPRSLLLGSIGNKAFNERNKNKFKLESEKYDESESLRQRISLEEDNQRANDFMAEIRQKRINTENQLKLEILLLDYIFMQDDGEITSDEKHKINKHFKKYKGKVINSVIKDIERLDEHVSLDTITRFVQNQNMDKHLIKESYDNIKLVTKKKTKYTLITERIIETLLIEDK